MICKNCRGNNIKLKSSQDFKNRFFTPGIKINGGLSYVSFRALFVYFGLKYLAPYVKVCKDCKNHSVECPHCSEELTLKEAQEEKCPYCKGKFYFYL